MSQHREKNVELNKVYVSLDQWKSDFLPNKLRSEHLCNLTRSEKSLNDNKQVVEIIDNGSLTLQRLFC